MKLDFFSRFVSRVISHESPVPLQLSANPTPKELRTFLQTVPGMIDVDRCIQHFALCAGQCVDGDVVEVGSWQGRNTIALGVACELSVNGKVYAIDHFGGNPGSQDYYVVGESDLSDLKSGFQENIRRANLENWVTLFDQPRELFTTKLAIRLLFIDGNHERSSVQGDLDHFLPMLLPRAIVIFDDYSPEFPGVVETANKFASSPAVRSSFTLGRSRVVYLK